MTDLEEYEAARQQFKELTNQARSGHEITSDFIDRLDATAHDMTTALRRRIAEEEKRAGQV